MPEMSPANAAVLDSDAKIKNLCDSVARSVDEKADLQKSVEALTEANIRLATELKTCIAEKGELQKQLALKSGMGIQENRPETFGELQGRTPDRGFAGLPDKQHPTTNKGDD